MPSTSDNRTGGEQRCTPRVLIAEDDSLIALDLQEMVVDAGGVVLEAVATAADAVRAAEQHRPDVVMMDVTLAQRSDGIDAAREIRRRFDTPILFVTGSSDQGTRARLAEFGSAEVVFKPVGPEELERALRRAAKPK